MMLLKVLIYLFLFDVFHCLPFLFQCIGVDGVCTLWHDIVLLTIINNTAAVYLLRRNCLCHSFATRELVSLFDEESARTLGVLKKRFNVKNTHIRNVDVTMSIPGIKSNYCVIRLGVWCPWIISLKFNMTRMSTYFLMGFA